MNLKDILKELEENSHSQRDKGTKFELLIKNWFLTTKLYSDNIKEIWLWDEFPYRNQFGGSDSGIDLIIHSLEDEYLAIQCKFYKENSEISKSDVDTFISTSSKLFEINGETKKFSGRIFISTTNKWSKKASDLIENQEISVIRISLNELENSDVDWSKIYLGKNGKEAKKASKTIRNHQKEARDSANKYFKENDRGKLIMACGTGKTFTSLKIAENETNKNGFILFLVPSIALLGQTLREWTNDIDKDTKLYPICICSDSKISSKKSTNDDNITSVVDLALPATTDIDKIVNQLEKIKDKNGMKVVFSTYQSIDVIAKAQEKILAQDKNFGEFDLIICDEAHRTTGVTLKNEDESNFVKVHKNDFLKAKKRLYMTATPRLYDDNSKSKAKESDTYLCSMDDKKLYGEEIYRIGFGKAVENNLLADYKVLILTLNSSQIPRELQAIIANGESEFKVDDATKLIGCINGLSKQILETEGIIKSTDPEPMKRAVAFCRDIKTSKRITNNLNNYSKDYILSLKEEAKKKMVDISSKHIDGGMNALEREDLLSWLKEDVEEKECRILTNARCLSEGVDVPNLDAVLFLSAKNSQVDVVQSVGRVMRKAPYKKYGYIIIPVLIPENINPEEALNDNEAYKVVWSVLNALRAHDDRFNAVVNKIDINKTKPTNIIIGAPDNSGDGNGEVTEPDSIYDAQKTLPFPIEVVQNAIYAKMVEKVGDRKYFEQWAKDVAKIAQIQKDRIRVLIDKSDEHKKAFESFIKGLQENINSDIDSEEAIEMLSQHIITKPIFEALFENYSFVKNNPISSSMEEILNLLLKEQIEKETEELKIFYDDVRVRVGNIDNSEGKQKIIVELYEKFFKTAFPKLVEKLGIVYTPIEVVDFIINSVEDILKKEFNRSLTDENVNILEPFVGTGTFISRLLQSGNIKAKDLERKYQKEIFANEIVLLAYYIATVNIENIYHDLNNEKEYKEFKGICLTDTFQLGEDKKELQLISTSFKENSERIKRQKNAPLQIIFGNPPYTIGQNSANDNAQNKKYPILDNRISETYSKESSAGLNKALYDAYIKAFRWATDRLNNNGGGVIGFVTNGAWIDGTATTGFRKTIEKEFTSIYVFNLRGNQRTSGEISRKEGGKIFGGGSRTPIAITLLVKNPNEKREKAKIYYYDIGDYLSREEKLSKINDFKSIGSKKMDWQILNPNEEGDWINQRNDKFKDFIPLIDKDNKNNKETFFTMSSNGVVTSRDSWVYSYSKINLEKNMKETIAFYNKEIEKILNVRKKDKNKAVEDIIDTNPKNISWSRALKKRADLYKFDEFNKSDIVISLYRPFTKQYLYFNKFWNETPAQQDKFKASLSIGTVGIGGNKEFSITILNNIGDFQTLQNANFYPLYYIEEDSKDKSLFETLDGVEKENKKDGISDYIYNLAKEKYSTKITREDIFYYVYGFLHNEDYKKEFEADLKKLIPRLPLVDDYNTFKIYSDIGRELANLHLNYENIERDSNIIVEGEESNNFKVEKMRFENKDKKDIIIFNSNIKIKNIPLEAYDYQVNGKSAVEWIVERYTVSVNKDSGIENNPNLWCEENKNPRYILDLLLSIISLSLKTNELIKKLPKIEF
ncbi:DEAD/DEAH box helicase family protein [Fusobacterium simiae]|uniref:DEAD/DEAH box helicase n=1 Tax=Fusobacterium simiae TaxID=855 RepID=UPI0020C4A922|nr:type ISP restriction/modification enzyme [Fusobacterium simiae]MDC7955430.1 DEAD/DEAH box helicase family protein [Fusobacterium simiae]